MAKYIMCKNCKKVVEYEPYTKCEGGMVYTSFRCPSCGHVKENCTNHIHYGQDGIN